MAPTDRYLDLLERVLLRQGFEDGLVRDALPDGWAGPATAPARRLLARRGLRVVEPLTADPRDREEGRDWPPTAETMIGRHRLRHLRRCVETILADGVPGDLLEAGVWRGGAAIMMRAVLAAHEVTDRTVWLADSFAGLPPSTHPEDLADGLALDGFPELAVSEESVRANFDRYGLLDEQVRFVRGWFADTLAGLPAERFALIRLDGDLYESTRDAIAALYPRLAPGGFLVVDDYGAIPACARAVHDYRDAHGITDPIEWIDWTGVWWRKS